MKSDTKNFNCKVKQRKIFRTMIRIVIVCKLVRIKEKKGIRVSRYIRYRLNILKRRIQTLQKKKKNSSIDSEGNKSHAYHVIGNTTQSSKSFEKIDQNYFHEKFLTRIFFDTHNIQKFIVSHH